MSCRNPQWAGGVRQRAAGRAAGRPKRTKPVRPGPRCARQSQKRGKRCSCWLRWATDPGLTFRIQTRAVTLTLRSTGNTGPAPGLPSRTRGGTEWRPPRTPFCEGALSKSEGLRGSGERGNTSDLCDTGVRSGAPRGTTGTDGGHSVCEAGAGAPALHRWSRGGGGAGRGAAPPRAPRVRPRPGAHPAPARRPEGPVGESRPPSPPGSGAAVTQRRGGSAAPRRPPPTFLPKFPRGRRARGRARGGGRAGRGPGPGLAGGSVNTGLPLPANTPPSPASRPPDTCPTPPPPPATRGRSSGRSPGPRSLRRRPSLAAHPAPASQARDPLTPRRKCGRPPGRLTAGVPHSPSPTPERQRPPAQSEPGPRASPGGGTMLIVLREQQPLLPLGSPAHEEE